jgi:hypothetical protein
MRACVFASLLGSTALAVVFAFAACGGNKQEAKGPDTTTSAPAGTSGTSGTPDTASTATSTTTMTLGDGGDLQGAKLGSSSTTVIENRSDAGARPRGSGDEAGRTREDIRAIVAARRDEARACYDEGLKKNPNIEGDLDIFWKIDPEGNVTETGVDDAKSTIRDKGVSDCIIAIIKRIHFAKSNKGYESRMHYPFNFHPKTGQVGKGAQQPPPKN